MTQYIKKQALVRFTVAVWLALFQGQAFSQEDLLVSPDKTLSVQFKPGNSGQQLLQYSLSNNQSATLTAGMIGFETKAHLNVSKLKLSVKPHELNSSWHPVLGERSTVTDHYSTLCFRFWVDDKSIRTVDVECRLYNEGFAYRYIISGKQTIEVTAENSRFFIPHAAKAWVTPTAQGVITAMPIASINKPVDRPVTVQSGEESYLAIGEAALVNFARMKFISSGDTLVSQLDGPSVANKKLQSPWRYILTGNSPGQLLERNDLLRNLNEPNKIRNTDWIKPGKVIREVTLNTEGSFRTIDFAASHGLDYILFDAGWYGREDADSSDAKTVTLDPLRSKGPLDLQAVIEYGKTKNVGVFLYVNRRALERQGDTLFALYEKWGIAGVKFGFVNVGSQHWTNWVHDRVRSAAAHHLLVDIHDEYRPTGYSRTYPNLLTQEGIRGDEESPALTQSIKTIFTRMIAGAADNTNCYFTPRVDKMGSHTAQMAKALTIYSPLQFLFWYDRPAKNEAEIGNDAIIREVPELAWYKNLPVTWDDTRVLESSMETIATIARRKGENWFLASLNAGSQREVSWKCDFLEAGKKYKALIYQDEPAASSTNVSVTEMELSNESILNFSIPAESGLAIQINVE